MPFELMIIDQLADGIEKGRVVAECGTGKTRQETMFNVVRDILSVIFSGQHEDLEGVPLLFEGGSGAGMAGAFGTRGRHGG